MTQSVERAITLPASGSFRSPDGTHPWPRGTILPGGYTIERTLGQGGFAVVYEASHPRHGLVAVKVLDRGIRNDEATDDRFIREAEIAASVDHPNVLCVHEMNRAHDGAPFLVMELLHGEDLSDVIERQQLDVAATVEIGLQLAQALEALWEAGIIHRDLKPHNVLIHLQDGAPRAKLIDFGIATSTEDSAVTSVQKLTATGVILGTPHYLSPEQARGEELDVRADLYALGVVLYEALSGRAPFEEGNLNALIASVLRDDRPPITKFLPDCPQALCDLLSKALERDREDRFQTPRELIDALEGFADAEDLPRGEEALVSIVVSKKLTLPWELRNLAPVSSGDRPVPVPFRTAGRATPREVSEGRWDATPPHGSSHETGGSQDAFLAEATASRGPRRHLAPMAAVAGVVLGFGIAGLMGGRPTAEARAASFPKAIVSRTLPAPQLSDSAEQTSETAAPQTVGASAAEPTAESSAPEHSASEHSASEHSAPEHSASDTGVRGNVAAARGVAAVRASATQTETPTTGEPAAAARPTEPAPAAAVSVEDLTRQAHQAYVRGRLTRARSLYLRATRVDSNSADAWRGYGLVSARLSRNSEARSALQRYLRLRPTAPDASAVRRQLTALR